MPLRARMGQRGLHQRGGDAAAFGLRRHFGVHDVHHAAAEAVDTFGQAAIDPRLEARRRRVVMHHDRMLVHRIQSASCCQRKAYSSAIMSARWALSAAPPWPPSMFS